MPQRTNTAPVATLAGVYQLAGHFGPVLTRDDDRVTLAINDTRRPDSGAARYVTVTRGFRTEYGGNLYGPDGKASAGATADLDGCQFQDKATRVRYVITATGPGVFDVQPVQRKRGAKR